MKITAVTIKPITPHNGLVGFASVTLDDKLVLHSIGIYTRQDGQGYRITYPTKRALDRSSYLYHPIDKELGSEIALAVLRKADYTLKEVNYVRHSHTHNPKGIL
jgi:stage V sporulation protein G